ncbi:tRNA (adenosine(37)-N6)-threonylcarbamoyltransferase complex ATPase subunit type 1 TsaE [Candidatus Neoehrlichia procyonis]|uniref:tRNA threonylcarbamoyladenosine biosynthesis protein TsaE n=1 Tax=Candidatus Neoehrlichia procyonis str. RAC413 TaxID=1359163 RepID=A0A0F3NNV5_9RICK|nr:tRNA (adenosine(37)-N6)-threonylcarbamoyltransferase complex ATPase subunit type 1 TsaE [Candidatus Neoehrlichia lotoris]KJV69387.1 tRNA threonylcarbamoyl adenosine modification protein YjeE [Candidatus Neoehrlichia lotoris str. RAC413]
MKEEEKINLTYNSVNLKFVSVLASKIAVNLEKGDSLSLTGELGVGKTVISRFIINTFLPNEDVCSPTFSLINEYQCSKFIIYHADFYRLKSINEVYEIGFLDMVTDNVGIIEWPELVQNIINFSLCINLQYSKKNNTRNIIIKCNKSWYNKLIT